MKRFDCTFLRHGTHLNSEMHESTFSVYAEDLIMAKAMALQEVNAPHRAKYCLKLLWVEEGK